jgi:small subunit ribosomal protein S20
MNTPAAGKKEEGKKVRRASAKKRQTQNEKKRLINKGARSRIKTAVRSFRETPQSEETKKKQMLKEMYSLADKASKKKVFHKNKANRLKSRLALSLRRKTSA